MADEETKEQPEEQQQDTGLLILQELKMLNRLLGAINQNITTTLAPIKSDVEMCKVSLAKMRKMGAQEVTIKDDRSQVAPQIVPPVGAGQNQL